MDQLMETDPRNERSGESTESARAIADAIEPSST
jgi:hypothetical protein